MRLRIQHRRSLTMARRGRSEATNNRTGSCSALRCCRYKKASLRSEALMTPEVVPGGGAMAEGHYNIVAL